MGDEAKSSLALRATASGGPPMGRLEVPEPLQQTDNTPTPTTQLLREVEAVGLFSDSAEAVVAALNPFDEHFRKAAAEGSGGRTQINDTPSVRVAKSAEEEGSLHTPNILISDAFSVSVDTASSSAALSAGIAVTRNNASKHALKSYRPIKPSTELEKRASQTAKLMLRLPTGEAIHLSDMPLIKMEGDGDSTPTREPSRKERLPSPAALSVGQLKPALQSGGEATGAVQRRPASAAEEQRRSRDKKLLADVSTRQDNLERNRAAAQRSRDKKKRKSTEMEYRLAQISRDCGNLATENQFLRQELLRLKSLLRMHLDCDVTKESGLQSLILSEVQPKILACANPVMLRPSADAQTLNVASRDILDEATRVIRENSIENGGESCQAEGSFSEASKQTGRAAKASRPSPKKQKL